MKNIPGKKSWITSITQNTPLFTIYKGGRRGDTLLQRGRRKGIYQ